METKKKDHFPLKLHFMLEQVEKDGLEHIVSWLPDGTAFRVHNVELFEARILPEYFKTKLYKSFQRNLSWYRFSLIESETRRATYKHSMFLKRNRDLCLSMRRPSSHQGRRQQGSNNHQNRRPMQQIQNDTFSKSFSPSSSVAQYTRSAATVGSFPEAATSFWTNLMQGRDGIDTNNNSSYQNPLLANVLSYENNILADEHRTDEIVGWLFSECNLSLDTISYMLDPGTKTAAGSTISDDPDMMMKIKFLFDS